MRPAAVLVLVLAGGISAHAGEVVLGARTGYYADAGRPFVGGEVVVRIGERLQAAPNAEVLLVDEGHSLTVNADLLLDLTCSCSPRSRIWAGGGLGVATRGRAGVRSRTDLGANLLTGVGVRVGRMWPYAQLKAVARRHPELVAAVGVRF